MQSAKAAKPLFKQRISAGYSVPGAVLLSVVIGLPLITLIWLAANGTTESLSHVIRNVLPNAGYNTLVVMLGVAACTAIIGTGAAWIISHFDFPLRNVLQWALMLPLAVPTYISAYTFVEYFSFTGPLQEMVRDVGGYQSSREYWFPEIRSLGGTVFVLSLVLYPYVYLSVRTLFLLQGSHIRDSARVLGARGPRLFFSITLPLARPAVFLGVTLAMMETINDIGAVEYLGTNTLTLSVFSVWLNQNDLPGATQIAIFLLMIVFSLIYLEHRFRGQRRFHETRSRRNGGDSRIALTGLAALGATLFTLTPVVLGFGIPVYVLAGFALDDIAQLGDIVIISELLTTITLATIAAILAIIGGLLLSVSLRYRPTAVNRAAVRFASIGYAVPGTLIALGVFIPFAAFDNALDGFLRQTLGISSGLLLTGSGAALVFAYVVRFMAMAQGNLENGLSKLSPNLDMAARNLGRNRFAIVREILMPLSLPAIYTAGLLVFVDVVKELSATILLRPFGMNTLATHVYDFASQGRVEDGALACLLIVLVGILPVIFVIGRSNTR